MMKRIATAFLAACMAALAPQAAAQDAAPPTLIIGATILELSGEEPRKLDGQAVLVEGGVITAVGPVGEVDTPEGARIVDGAGHTLMPGLVDMHVHVWDEAELGAYLANGVTTVRNMSGMPFLLAMGERIERGELAGPRLVTTGPILNSPGPNAQLNHQIVEDAEAARAAVRWQHSQGFGRVKVYSNLGREPFEAILAEAQALGMPVTGHTAEGPRAEGVPATRPFAIPFEFSLKAGFETIEHVESIVWHGLRNRQDEDAARELARRIAASGVPVDATLIAFENLARIADTKGAHLSREGTDRLNPFIGATETEQFERWSNEDAERAKADAGFYRRFTGMLAEEGALIVAGSDAGIATNIPGVSLHDELDFLMEAGLEPFAVLRAATILPARILAADQTAGQIAPGQRADLLLVEGDPLADIAVLRQPAAVIANGRLYTRDDIAGLWASASRTDPARTQQNVLAAMAQQGTEIPLGE
ncbi:amidohydrolase family protein [Qipengyuania flava]|uniref:amidohydrolase family protein n=1 Tax=Qipengyuania flava TaxID=192812 RepID=UPI001C630764|nr:amidohydrolase family protein [Qipengyuania flava]QYJ08279.1 amidohydrolase family protein [Qipengyuania flava]